jgi:hypothetical protein
LRNEEAPGRARQPAQRAIVLAIGARLPGRLPFGFVACLVFGGSIEHVV